MTQPQSVDKDAVTGLPLWPRRNRRELDAKWIEATRRLGIDRFHAARPSPNTAPPELERAIRQFNRGDFWECHETLEDVWRETRYPCRLFYHAIIKTAVGYHHLGARNRNGALIKLRDSAELLDLFRPAWMGWNVERLRVEVCAWLAFVEPESVDWAAMEERARPRIARSDDYAVEA